MACLTRDKLLSAWRMDFLSVIATPWQCHDHGQGKGGSSSLTVRELRAQRSVSLGRKLPQIKTASVTSVRNPVKVGMFHPLLSVPGR